MTTLDQHPVVAWIHAGTLGPDDAYWWARHLATCAFGSGRAKREERVPSWAAEVVADSTGKWCGNGLRFRTRVGAEAYVSDLAIRWTLVRETRVVESNDPPNREE